MKTDMKKILIPVLSLLMAAFAVSCTPQEPDYSGMKAVLGLEVADMQDLYEVNKRQQKTVNIKVTAEAVPGTTLHITLGVNPELVAAYNEANGKNYEMLPAEAYNFVDRELMLPRFNTISSLGQLNLVGMGCDPEKTYVLPVVIEKVEGSENYEIAENGVAYFVFKMLPALKGIGTKDDPYVIEELNDFVTINEKMLSGEVSYFSMKTDIDMAEVTDWVRINSKPYDAQINFDGNGHKITNYKGTTGLFHVLNGTFQNVVFENCEVAGAANTGMLADYLGYTDIQGHVKNVRFNNCKFSGGADSGLLSGYTYNALVEQVYMENCDIVLNGRRQGFLTGRVEADSEFKNCYVKGGSASGGTQQCGGLIGQNNLKTATITNCGISATIGGNRAMGAIMAYAKGPDGFTNIQNCIVWSPSVKCVPDPGNSYSSGVVVGCSDQNTVTFKNCLYRADIVFEERSTGMGVLHDSADIENAKLPTTTSDATTYANAFAWHGKAAAAGVTASQAAKQLKWDETIWDLNGAEPMLK